MIIDEFVKELEEELGFEFQPSEKESVKLAFAKYALAYATDSKVRDECETLCL